MPGAGRRSVVTGIRYTVTPDIPAPSSFTTRPVITPVWASVIRGVKIKRVRRRKSGRRGDRETERQREGEKERWGVLSSHCFPVSLSIHPAIFPSPHLPVPLSLRPSVHPSLCLFLICLSPFGSDQSQALLVVDWARLELLSQVLSL